MALFCYTTDAGKTVDREFARGEAPSTVRVDGAVAVRDYRAEHAGSMIFVKGSENPCRSWPMTCVASGVHERQAGELREHLAKRGCPTEVSKGGDPVYTSAAHRKKALKARGMFDRNSFF